MNVYALTKPDEQDEKWAAIYYACKEAGVSIPEEIAERWEGHPPIAFSGKHSHLPDEAIEGFENEEGYITGYVLWVDKIPAGIDRIVFSHEDS